MAETPAQDVKALFKRWRSGDADAGVNMAQRFSDWYYAITVMRLGDQNARAPLERACQTFAQRIMDITNADELIDFAHHIVLEEIRQAGGRSQGEDAPNAMTNGQAPSALLAKASRGMSAEQIALLHKTYASQIPLAQISPDLPAEAMLARHALKVWLSQNAEVPFTVLPRDPSLDQAPLPLYESARLASQTEEIIFEQWLLSDINLCKDIAEFSVFAHAIRAGNLQPGSSAEPAPSADRPAAPTTPTAPADTTPEPSGGGSGKTIAIAVVIAIVIGLALAKLLSG